jgi:hypothetical protein
MVTYDAQVVQKFADRLYTRAQSIVISCTLLGLLIGLFFGFGLGQMRIGQAGGVLGFAIVALFGVIGYMAGSERAFHLKLQAQLALCQVKIEENTRKA